jgi:hypothetical protein
MISECRKNVSKRLNEPDLQGLFRSLIPYGNVLLLLFDIVIRIHRETSEKTHPLFIEPEVAEWWKYRETEGKSRLE